MNSRPSLKYRISVYLIALAWCTLMAAIYATAYYESAARRGEEASWIREFIFHLVPWWTTMFSIVTVVWLNHAFPFRRGARINPVIVHLAASLIQPAGVVLLDAWIYKKVLHYESMAWFGLGNYLFNIMYYWMILGFYNGAGYYMRYRERVIKTSQLEAQLARAQLQLLKMQLHPHFLFNTLHAVSTLMHRDVDAAERMLSRLSDLLRLSLENVGLQEVTLRKELEFLKRYLDIERIRFGEKLVVDLNVAPEALGAYVPNLVLQPIVENAINHGISKIADEGRITLQASRHDHTLSIGVSDNGPGFKNGDVSARSRVGLANTQARLEQLYGGKGTMDFEAPDEGGFTVHIHLPFHTVPEDQCDDGMKLNG